MKPSLNVEKYPLLAQFFHWAMSLSLVMSVTCVFMRETDFGTRLWWMRGHTFFGALFLALLVPRIFVKLRSQFPALPLVLPPWERRLAEITHQLLYWLMLLAPLTGIILIQLKGSLERLWGTSWLQILVQNSELAEKFEEVHEAAAWALLVLGSLHAIAVLFQQYAKKNEIMKRMLP